MDSDEIPEEQIKGSVLPITLVNGFPFPEYCARQNILFTLTFQPRLNDIILCSYPMSISTWMLNSFWKLFKLTEENPDFKELNECLMPSLEYYGPRVLKADSTPNILRHNLPYWLVHRSPHAKYIYIARNPNDIVISYYCYAMHHSTKPIKFTDFFNDFIEGRLPYGNYFDHVLSWFCKRRQANVLFLEYYDMHINPKLWILRVAEFLGPKYYKVCDKDSFVDKILKYPNCQRDLFTIEAESSQQPIADLLQKHEKLQQLTKKSVHYWFPPLSDSGYVGISSNLLTVNQSQLLHRKMCTEFRGTNLFYRLFSAMRLSQYGENNSQT